MSYSIHKTIGWAMPQSSFIESTQLPLPEITPYYCIHDAIDDALREVDGMHLAALIRPISDIDGYNAHVVFYPDAKTAKKWQRRGDPIDFLDGSTDNNFEYRDIDMYPFDSFQMDENGVDKGYAANWTPIPLPGIPPEMRKWITKYNVLPTSGIAKLRPFYASWWS